MWTRPVQHYKYGGILYTAAADDILYLFHHIHQDFDEENGSAHEVHHCGGDHAENDPTVSYTIEHCSHDKHRIDKQTATGHAMGDDGEATEVLIQFDEKCSDGGWHVESGAPVEEER